MRDENAVAVIGRRRVTHPSQRLRQRTIRIRCLPTAHQLELFRQAVENIAFALQHPDAIARLPVSDGDVEVTTQYEVSAPAEGGDTVEDVLHCSDVSPFTGWSV